MSAATRRLEERYYSAFVGGLDEGAYFFGLQGFNQSQDGFVGLVAFLDNQNVCIIVLDDFGGAVFDGESVLNLQACIDGVVAVDNCDVNGAEGSGS